MKLVMAQINLRVGDLDGNARRITHSVQRARDEFRADLVVFPELSITGYPPDDLLLRPGFLRHAEETLREVAARVKGIDAVVGFPERSQQGLYNSCAWLRDGTVVDVYRKGALPNYAVFDEKRYFRAASQPMIIDCAGSRVGVVICEDLWEGHPVVRAAAAGADILLSPNASPYALGKREERRRLVSGHAVRHKMDIVYCNLITGQDDLVFDGGSFVAGRDGSVVGLVPVCEEGLYALRLDDDGWHAEYPTEEKPLAEEEEIWRVLRTGVRDYVDNNGFPGVLVGLSGGVDSAVVAALAADALGPERVTCVLMPSRFTSHISTEDAERLAENLGVKRHSISIEASFEAFLEALRPYFDGMLADITEQNLQARSRGVILMALSNKLGDMLLATSNKSELAVGYATIYGDMCGGFAPIKDCYKTRVYQLARYCNRNGEVIPRRILERPPTAELAHDQTDQDSLPPYEELDPILLRYVEKDESIHDIAAAGHDMATVRRVAAMVLKNEYKRRQAAPGPRITPRAFGRDRRYPITSGWREGL